ncbi:hypothetical protein B0J11DRAFT_36381 [Dendryphion nanum]|uniref:Uncharacterized protein n=1 Tax=Dendryphion nanum TaxID=256645 RepID=A0A9P9ELJ6_9PLEO|nr:hypothetical protein B0J11DRAFT_36381 [Dendryphion nanum]
MRSQLFTSLVVALGFTANIAQAEKINLEIGYAYTFVVTPGPDPGLGCGPWSQLAGADGSTLSHDGLVGQSDGCPSWEKSPFCSRWKCPKRNTYGKNLIAVEFMSDEPGNKIKVRAARLNGKEQEVICDVSVETKIQRNDFALYRTHICFLDI